MLVMRSTFGSIFVADSQVAKSKLRLLYEKKEHYCYSFCKPSKLCKKEKLLQTLVSNLYLGSNLPDRCIECLRTVLPMRKDDGREKPQTLGIGWNMNIMGFFNF